MSQLVIVCYDCPDSSFSWLVKNCKDSRLTIVNVPPKVTGPFFNHGLARNVGAQVAKYPTYLFLDADAAFMWGSFHDEIVENMTRDEPKYDVAGFINREDLRATTLPESYKLFGQLFVRSNTFYHINGFNRVYGYWGYDAQDFVIRALKAKHRYKILDSMNRPVVYPTKDVDRFAYSPGMFQDTGELYERAHKYYTENQEIHFRANPGTPFGLPHGVGIRVYTGGTMRSFHPDNEY